LGSKCDARKLSGRKNEDLRFAEVQAKVVIAEHRGYGRNLFKRENDRGRTNVSGMKDVFNALEKRRHLRIQVTVSIRDDADFHNDAGSVARARQSGACENGRHGGSNNPSRNARLVAAVTRRILFTPSMT
jgi:hypothetical protein